ncbi:hypothetical protein VTJ04DRAFT_7455 [Mycothermus thermophilus]|uniref:uncharacterized protein n=1 Tax=Humicola insolens TaxID=85995 RepID=UPI003742E2AD
MHTMKAAISLLSIAGIAGISMAQNFEGQPACATGCLISAISAAGCAGDDIGCQCGPTQSVIAQSAAPCLITSCNGPELIQAQSAGQEQCSRYSATAAADTDATTTTEPAATGTTTTTAESSSPAETSTSSAGAMPVATPMIVGAGAALLGVLGVAVAL